jgi:prepilin-type N-terminal cleavage/methylation domain-containing protein
MKMNRKGFTLVEIMIVVAIIGLLAAIAIPNFLKSRETSRMNACINNLRQIDGAKEQWAIAKKKKEGDAIEATEVWEYIKGGKEPTCAVGTLPTCSLGTDAKYPHKLPETEVAGG